MRTRLNRTVVVQNIGGACSGAMQVAKARRLHTQATPEALRATLAAQIPLWTPIIEKAGIQAK